MQCEINSMIEKYSTGHKMTRYHFSVISHSVICNRHV